MRENRTRTCSRWLSTVRYDKIKLPTVALPQWVANASYRVPLEVDDADRNKFPESNQEADYLDIYALNNLAITTSYLNSGFAGKFIDIPMSFYLISILNATPAQMSAFKGNQNCHTSFR